MRHSALCSLGVQPAPSQHSKGMRYSVPTFGGLILQLPFFFLLCLLSLQLLCEPLCMLLCLLLCLLQVLDLLLQLLQLTLFQGGVLGCLPCLQQRAEACDTAPTPRADSLDDLRGAAAALDAGC